MWFAKGFDEVLLKIPMQITWWDITCVFHGHGFILEVSVCIHVMYCFPDSHSMQSCFAVKNNWSISCFSAALVCHWTGVKIPLILTGPPGLPSSGHWNLKFPKPRPGISLMTCPISNHRCSWCCWGCWCAGWVDVTFSYDISSVQCQTRNLVWFTQTCLNAVAPSLLIDLMFFIHQT